MKHRQWSVCWSFSPFMCVCGRTRVCMCVTHTQGSQRLMSGASLHHSPSCLMRHHHSLNLQLTSSAKPAGQRAPGILRPHFPSTGVTVTYCCAHRFRGCWKLRFVRQALYLLSQSPQAFHSFEIIWHQPSQYCCCEIQNKCES